MTTNRIAAIVGGAVLFILGLIIGAAISGGPSVEDIDAAVAKRIDAATATETAEIAKVGAGLTQLAGDLGGRLDGGAKAVADIGTKLGGDVAALGASLQGAIEKSSADHLAALEGGLAGLRGQISSAPAAAPGAATPAAAAATAASAAPVEGYGPGETAILSDGALRVFVSRLDADAGTASVRAGGADLALALGESQTLAGPAGECQVTLDAVGGGKAALSGACGAALPEAAGAAPGSIVDLAEGLRVFVSGVTDAGARIALNGVRTVTVPVGESIEATVGDKNCQVTVEGVDRGRVALGYACG